MISLEEKKLLKDIQYAIAGINEHLESRRVYEEFKSSNTKRRAIEREFEIIGEAMNNLLKINPVIPLSNGRKIVAMRNRIIHAYDNLNDVIIWKIIMEDMPLLEKEVIHLLNDK